LLESSCVVKSAARDVIRRWNAVLVSIRGPTRLTTIWIAADAQEIFVSSETKTPRR
jgi:hypothetical protein